MGYFVCENQIVSVKWYCESNFNWVKFKNIDELAENKIDTARASVNDTIQHRYQLTLAY